MCAWQCSMHFKWFRYLFCLSQYNLSAVHFSYVCKSNCHLFEHTSLFLSLCFCLSFWLCNMTHIFFVSLFKVPTQFPLGFFFCFVLSLNWSHDSVVPKHCFSITCCCPSISMTDSLPHDRSPSCDKETKNTRCTFSRICNVGAQISTNLKEIVSIGEAIS
jgi:hypothetical protein